MSDAARPTSQGLLSAAARPAAGCDSSSCSTKAPEIHIPDALHSHTFRSGSWLSFVSLQQKVRIPEDYFCHVQLQGLPPNQALQLGYPLGLVFLGSRLVK